MNKIIKLSKIKIPDWAEVEDDKLIEKALMEAQSLEVRSMGHSEELGMAALLKQLALKLAKFENADVADAIKLEYLEEKSKDDIAKDTIGMKEAQKYDREETLIAILNKMIELFEPIKFEDMNMDFGTGDKEKEGKLIALEKIYKEVGLKYIGGGKKVGFSVIALIAMITDVLIGRRLVFEVNTETGVVEGFNWFSKD